MDSISVVIPVYNAAPNLKELYHALTTVLDKTVERYEIILVEDRGRDNSWDIIRELVQADSRVSGIRLRRNYGQHNALLCGIRAARYEIIVTMDDDLQHPPAEIATLLSKLAEGYDVVYGTPRQEQHGLWRDLASQLTKLALSSTMGVEVASKVSAFRAFRTELRDAFSEYRSPTVSIDVLLTWGTSRFAAVPVRHEPRRAGTSNYTLGKLITHAFNLMTGFSTLPLQVASFIGFGFTLFGFGILAYVLARYFLNGAQVPGFAFLASIIALFSGAQLFALGIIGEYIARIHFRTMERPPYVVGNYLSGDMEKQLSFERGFTPDPTESKRLRVVD